MHPLGRDYRCPGIWHNKNHSHAYRLKYIKTIDVWNQSSWCLEIQKLSLRFGLSPLSNLQVAPEFFPEDTESSEHRTSVLAVLQDVCSVGFMSLNKPQGKTQRTGAFVLKYHFYKFIEADRSWKVQIHHFANTKKTEKQPKQELTFWKSVKQLFLKQ